MTIQRQGAIEPGACTQSTQRWISTRSRQETSIGLLVDCRADPYALLIYSRQAGTDVPTVERVRASISVTQPHYGGRRYWWHCPRCNRRVRILYLPPGAGDFRCRVCWCLTYESSNESDKRVSALVNDPLKMLALSRSAMAGSSKNIMLLLRAYDRLEKRWR